MTLLHSLLEMPIVTRLGWVLLHSIWQVSAVALILALVLPLCRKRGARLCYGACCAALLMTVALPAITFFLVPEQAPVRIASAGAPEKLTVDSVHQDAPDIDEVRQGAAIRSERPLPILEDRPLAIERLVDNATSPPPPAVPVLEMVATFGRQIMAATSSWLPWVVVGWLLGVAALSLWNLGGWMAVQRLKAHGTSPISLAIQQAAERMARQLGLNRTVRLLGSSFVDSPLVIGAFKPLILLPASLLCQLPPDQLESLLAHELAHILRQDYLINLLQCAIETLLFYHPAVWWISAQTRVQREYCCDDIAVSMGSDRSVYVRALAAVAEAKTKALAPAAGGRRLLPRLQRLLGTANPRTSHTSRWLTGMAALTFCATVIAFLAVRSHSAVAQTKTEADAAQAKKLADAAAQERAIQAVLRVGGTIRRDAKIDGNPVTAVYLGKGQVSMRGKPDVTDAILKDLKEFKSLKTLRLNGAAVTDAGMADLIEIMSLESLVLNRTQITDLGLKSLQGLKNLQGLYLEDTGVSDAGLKGIKDLESLQTLVLTHTRVTDVGLKELAGLKKLRTLSISGAQVTDAGLKELTALQSLETLDLSEPRGLDAGLKELAELRSLKTLILIGPQWTDAALKHLKELPGLQTLSMSETDITNEGLINLKKLPGLRTLHLSGMLVSDGGLKELAGLKNLQRLALSRLAVTDAGLPNLIQLINLQTLVISDTNVTDAGIELLKTALPHCQIQTPALRAAVPRPSGSPVPSDKQAAAVHTLEKLGGRISGIRARGRVTETNAVLNGYQITDAVLKDVKELTSLQSLRLNQTSVTDAGLHELEGLINLRQLSFDGTSITDEGLKYLRGFTDLRTLSLRNTKVTDAGLKNLKGLKNLQGLNVGFTNVTEEGLHDLKQALPECLVVGPGPTGVREELRPLRQPVLRQPVLNRRQAPKPPEVPLTPVAAEKETQAVQTIRRLGGRFVRDADPKGQIVDVDFRGTKVTDADLKEIAQLTNLQRLYLGRTAVTDAGLKELKGLKNLVFLGLLGIKASETVLKELQEALPRCQIMGGVGATRGQRRPPVDGQVAPVQVAPKIAANESPTVMSLQKQGAEVVRDAKIEGNPVVGIYFNIVGVTDSDLKKIKEFKDLKAIGLQGFGITDKGLRELTQFKNLEMLRLVNTAVTDTGLRELKAFKNLRGLTLEGIGVTDAGLRELKELPNLRTLILGGPKISNPGFKNLKELKNIEVLIFRFTSINDACLKDIGELRSLKTLYLGGTQITDAGLGELKNLKGLDKLDLSHAEVADAGLAYLAALPSLRTLNLDHTNVTDAGLIELRKLTNLQDLDLNRTLITDAGLSQLKGLKNLRRLNLLNTAVTSSARRELHKALPDCRMSGTGGTLGPREQ